jgi:hypothetical protein
MSIQAERAAQDSPAYDSSLRHAAKRAAAGVEQAVYWDGKMIYVRPCGDAAPANATVVCIAQKWNDHTVQLRFAGARSEWVHS